MASPTRPRPGDLKDRLTLQQRALDDNGDRNGDWGSLGTVWAQVLSINGGETVMEQRLQGKQPVILFLRASSVTTQIDNSFRAIDARNASRVFDITSASLSQDRAWMECLAVQLVGQTVD